MREEKRIEMELQECTFSPRREDVNGEKNNSADLKFVKTQEIRSPDRFY